MKNLLLLIGFLFSFVFATNAQEIPAEITTGFTQGKAALITPYLNSNIRYVAPASSSKQLSPQEVSTLLERFFKEVSPTQFQIIHKGETGRSGFAIGELSGTSGKYRIHCFFNTTAQFQITQLRIEKEND